MRKNLTRRQKEIIKENDIFPELKKENEILPKLEKEFDKMQFQIKKWKLKNRIYD